VPVSRGPHDNLPPGDHDVVARHTVRYRPRDSRGHAGRGALARGQADRAATYKTAAGATTLNARVLIRRTTYRSRCAGVSAVRGRALFGLARSDETWSRLGRILLEMATSAQT